MSGTPDMVIVQASSRSWSGSEDFCLRLLDGEPAVAWTIRGAAQAFPDTPIRVAAPEFDRGGRLDEVAGSIEGCTVEVFYGFDEAPLDRLIAVTEPLADSAPVLRVDGLHFATDFDLAGRMIEAADADRLDCVKAPDDFPPQLAPDVYRVGALRRARSLIGPGDEPFLVHPKFLMLRQSEDFEFRHFEQLPEYPESLLRDIRARSSRLIQGVERLDVDERLRVRHGDQLSFHYELAGRYLPERPRLLDVACGDGFGARLLAPRCASVHGADLDAPSIEEARLKSSPEIEFIVADCTAMPYEDRAFDAVVSMETLEHVPVAAFLAEVERVLEPGGILVLSTPQSSLGHVPFTPAHEREFSLEELTGYLAERFEIIERIGLKAGTIFFPGDPVGTNSFIVCRRR